MAIQITSGQLIDLPSYALTKPNNCHPDAHNTQKCQNSQTINFHTHLSIGIAFLQPLKS